MNLNVTTPNEGSILSNQNAQADSPVKKKVVVAAVAGNALEFYDFIVYAFFAVYIGNAFFPATDPYVSLLLSVAVYGVGFFSRPLGAIFIGGFADRIGRKPAMLLTIMLITVGTLGLAFTPTYAAIGVAAPIIIVICRLIQGFALGGEVGPSTAFLVEIAPENKKGFFVSWQLASQGVAAMMAGLIGLLMSLILPLEQLADWGWRVPFLFCLLLIPIGIYLRRDMPETREHGTSSREHQGWGELRGYTRLIILAILSIMGLTVSTYVAQYMTTYAITTLKLSPSVAIGATIAGGLAVLICSLIGGWMSDRIGRWNVMFWPRVMTAVIIVPLFIWLTLHPSPTTLFLTSAILAGITSISGAATFIAIPELLPRSIRATGLSIAYGLSVTIFGGTTHFIITYLIKTTGNPISPAWYVMVTSLIAAGAIYLIPESSKRRP
ncbi:MFS transporter [Ochrobactrum sp. MYb379]|uniref:MFS transporter n=1 Tax=Ochrobactrum sp. MYb379 TaxID=2745275 RepID=UPI0030A9DF3A